MTYVCDECGHKVECLPAKEVLCTHKGRKIAPTKQMRAVEQVPARRSKTAG